MSQSAEKDRLAVSADHRIRITQPTRFQIVGPDGNPLLTIHDDGRWEFRDEAAPTEAARVFVREVQRLVGQQPRHIPPAKDQP